MLSAPFSCSSLCSIACVELSRRDQPALDEQLSEPGAHGRSQSPSEAAHRRVATVAATAWAGQRESCGCGAHVRIDGERRTASGPQREGARALMQQHARCRRASRPARAARRAQERRRSRAVDAGRRRGSAVGVAAYASVGKSPPCEPERRRVDDQRRRRRARRRIARARPARRRWRRRAARRARASAARRARRCGWRRRCGRTPASASAAADGARRAAGADDQRRAAAQAHALLAQRMEEAACTSVLSPMQAAVAVDDGVHRADAPRARRQRVERAAAPPPCAGP